MHPLARLFQCPEVPEKVSITSFKSTDEIQDIQTKLEEAFHALSIEFKKSKQHAFWYNCKTSKFEFNVCIYKTDKHLVEFDHYCGCRYAFSQVAVALSNHLQVEFISPYRAIPFKSPPYNVVS